MPRFAANLSLMFTEHPFMERFRAAKDAGFDAVEVLFPYDCPAQDMRDKLVWNSQTFVMMNGPPPNFTGGPRGFAAEPGAEERFRRDFDRVMRYAGVLRPHVIGILAGRAEGPVARQVFIDNLKWAAARAKGRMLAIEPMNVTDMPGYFLSDFDLAAEILDRVAAPNVGLLFDTCHAHSITGDALAAWNAHGHRAVHVQIAGSPGRTDPGRGEVDHRQFLAMLDAAGYDGFVTAEYAPEGPTEASLGWMRQTADI